MEANSEKAKRFKIVDGHNAHALQPWTALTRKDIKEFLGRFAEAIFVDQRRVNKLPRESFHSLYSKGMWKRCRERHLESVLELSMTVDEMPKRLLKKLTEMSVAYKPQTVKSTFLDLMSEYGLETAPRFFKDLVQVMSRRDPDPLVKGSPRELMLRWFDYDDPLRIAKDSECEYVDALVLHIERESKKTKRWLAAKGRYEFIKSRVALEFVEHLYPELHDR